MRDYAHNLPMALLRAREAVMSRFRPILRAHGLTEQQWRIIRALAESEGMDATALSEMTLISLPSLTRILRGMEESGFVMRESVEGDSRRRRVTLSREGQDMFARIAPQSEREYAELALSVGEADLSTLYALLDKVVTETG